MEVLSTMLSFRKKMQNLITKSTKPINTMEKQLLIQEIQLKDKKLCIRTKKLVHTDIPTCYWDIFLLAI